MKHVILLAAGYSSRFGSNKLLHIVDGTPMYRHALETAEQFRQRYCCEPVRLIFVTAYDDIGKQLREKDGFCLFGAAKAGNTAGRDLVVMNPNSGLGISHSIALGVKAAGADRFREDDSLMFMVCDQPWLTPGDLLNLAASFKRSGKSIGCMAYGEQTGNPVLFSAVYREELLGLRGDTGGKAIVRRHPNEVCLCPVSDPRALEDMDELQ